MGEGERGTKTTVLLLEAPYKDRALAGAALIDLLPLGHSSCSMLCRRSYLQCELPLPSSQATLQHPGSSTNCPHSVVAYAQRDVPMHSRPKLHAPATQVPRQDPVVEAKDGPELGTGGGRQTARTGSIVLLWTER